MTAQMSIATQFMGSSVVLNPEAREELLRATDGKTAYID